MEGEARFSVIESASQIMPPKRYLNKFGQLTEFAPYTERDLRVPQELESHTERDEFVTNVVTEPLAEAMILTSTEFPAQVNEFSEADLTPVPSVTERPPRVEESPIHFECRATQIVDLGDELGSGSIVIGHILHVYVGEALVVNGDKVDQIELKAIGRLGGLSYARPQDQFHIERPPSQLDTHR